MASLAKKVDAFVKENKKVNASAFVVLLGKQSDESKDKLKKLAKEHKLEIPLTIGFDSDIAKKLKLNEKVKKTVLIWNKQTVTANFALNDVTDKDVESVVAAAKEMVAKS